MSLLLDALRRAEEARRAKEASTSATQVDPVFVASGSLHIHPTQASPSRELALDESTSVLPIASAENDSVEIASVSDYQSGLALEEFSAPPIVETDASRFAVLESVPSRIVVETRTPQDNTQRDVARNVFAVKQPLPTSEGGDKRKWLIPAVVGIFVLLGAGGWYVWNEISRVSRPVVARTPGPPSPLPPAAPGTGQFGNKPLPAPETMVAKVEEMPIPPLLPPRAVDAPVPTLPASFATERTLSELEALARKLKDAPVASEAVIGLKLARSNEPRRIDPELSIAYQSLAGGDYVSAQKQYAKLVLAEPLNVDAQLGLATASARRGDDALAARHYRQVLALDPRNGLAIMGLLALNEGAQPASLEIELKTLIGRNPDAAPLHFGLGNLYASGRRWTEAQQAYFEAFRIDPQNPDYLFNLAVSLDQLRQTRLALEYYRKAESVVLAKGGGQFDRPTIAKRIKELTAENGRAN